MNVFFYEMKKIFSWKIILLIVFVNILLFKLLVEFNLTNFPNGRPAGDMFKIEQQLIKKYGTTIDAKEFTEIQRSYRQQVAAATKYLANDPEAVAVGFDTYEKFNDYDHDNQEKNDFNSKLFFENKLDFPWVLQSYETYIDGYKNEKTFLKRDIQEATGAKKERLEKLLKENDPVFYSSIVLKNFQAVIVAISITVFLSILLLISPIFIRDLRSNIIPLQYSSKVGRKIFSIKWLAGFVSSFLLAAVLLSLYIWLYRANHTESHFQLHINAMDAQYSWYDPTFLQYIILSVVLAFVFAVLLGVLTMAISTIAKNIIALIGIQIIVAFIMIAGVATFVIQNMISINYTVYFMPLSLLLFVLLTLFATYFAWQREKKRDILID